MDGGMFGRMNESMYDVYMLKYFKLNKHIKEKKKE
jgi:hypothetical protein